MEKRIGISDKRIQLRNPCCYAQLVLERDVKITQ